MLLDAFCPTRNQLISSETSYLIGLFLSGVAVLLLATLSIFIELMPSDYFSEFLYDWIGFALCTPILYYAGMSLCRSIKPKNYRFSHNIPILTILIIGYIHSLVLTLYNAQTMGSYFDCILVILFITLSGRYLEVYGHNRIYQAAQTLLPTTHPSSAHAQAPSRARTQPYAPQTYHQETLWYQMIMLIMAAVIFCWWLPYDQGFALYCGVCILLVSTPCAMAIAFPLTTARLFEACAQKGILIITPSAFYALNNIDQILFEKTNSSEENGLTVESVEYCNHAIPQNVLPLIAVIEKNTHHPVAQAIVQYALLQFSQYPVVTINRLRVFPDHGIRALVDGKFVLIGPAHWLRKNGIFISAEGKENQEKNLSSHSFFVHCAIGGIEVARLQLKDNFQDKAEEMVQFFKQRQIEMHIVDPANIFTEPKPIPSHSQLENKASMQILALQDQGYVTGWIGDGSENITALKQADISMVMGVNSPTAIANADIILQTPTLQSIQTCFELSRKTQKILKQNTFIGMVFSTSLLPFAAMGQLSPMLILAGSCLTALLVMGNASRLKLMT